MPKAGISSGGERKGATRRSKIRKGGPSPKADNELFFALVGPIGTDLPLVIDCLRMELGAVGYDLEVVKMSGLLEELPTFRKLPEAPVDKRIRSRMAAGDAVRKKMASGAALVYLAATYVRQKRKTRVQGRPVAFLFDSLKRPEEVKALRRIYEDALVCISVFAPKSTRIDNLARRIARSNGATVDEARPIATELVGLDQKGGDKQFGQDVANTFPLADVFIRHDSHERVQSQLSRIVELLFCNPFRTPTRDELGMFHARAAAMRSADLSRQVGAVLADSDGSILAAGCNEVPRPGGGLYWEGDEADERDFRRGRDANVAEKLEVLGELFGRLRKAGWLSSKIQRKKDRILATKSTIGGGVLDGTRVDSLIEFGRVVHAEMNALMNAALRGIVVEGATLYCTTFPCHNCARHLLAAGVSRVVYVEPYPKSLASKLYKPAISVDDDCHSNGQRQLRFDAFVGVAPRRFIPLFEMGDLKRKTSDGYVNSWERTQARPRFKTLDDDHMRRELMLLLELQNEARKLGLNTNV